MSSGEPNPATTHPRTGDSDTGRQATDAALLPPAVRRMVYAILIVLGLGAAVGRIAAVDAVDRTAIEDYRIQTRLNELRARLTKEKSPADTINERVAAERDRLREKLALRRPFLSGNDRSRWCTLRALVEPEFRVEGAPYAIDKLIDVPNWDTIDMVKHDGHFYSSKPPLLPALLAGPYWCIVNATGATLGTHPFVIGRVLLIAFNGLCLLVLWSAVASLAERFGRGDWDRMFVVAAAVFGTFLTTFVVVLNNHLPAAAAAAVALDAAARIVAGERRLRWGVLCGLATAFMVANEFPSAALAAPLGLVVLWRSPRQALLAAAPAVAVVVAAFFATNWIAHRDLRPAYTHRAEGDDWYDYTYMRNGREVQSYWKNRRGIDVGEASPARYALHVLVGHHGIFLLTPVWLISAAGVVVGLRRSSPRGERWLWAGLAAVSAVCIAFYLARPMVDRNYGGTTSAFRWVFWLAPAWLMMMLPALEWMSRSRIARTLALLALFVSAMSTAYPTWNPWTHPWALDYMLWMGWETLP